MVIDHALGPPRGAAGEIRRRGKLGPGPVLWRAVGSSGQNAGLRHQIQRPATSQGHVLRCRTIPGQVLRTHGMILTIHDHHGGHQFVDLRRVIAARPHGVQVADRTAQGLNRNHRAPVFRPVRRQQRHAIARDQARPQQHRLHAADQLRGLVIAHLSAVPGKGGAVGKTRQRPQGQRGIRGSAVQTIRLGHFSFLPHRRGSDPPRSGQPAVLR